MQENKKENKQENKPYEKAREWAALLCRYAGEDDAFCRDFWQRLTRSEGVFGEFVYYLEYRDFRCGYKVAGYSVIDIMVWQMDHFKARLDRGGDGMKDNGDRMLLMAFDTMLRMEQNPQKYVELMQSETGTDYPEKY